MNNFLLPHTGVAVLLALLAANCIAWGTVLREQVEESGSNNISVLNAIKQSWWWWGIVLSLLGYAFQAGALVFGSLILVQPLIALTFLFAIPIGAKLAHRKVTNYEWSWASLLTISVVVFILVGRPQPGLANQKGWVWAVIFISLGILVAGMVSIANIVGSKPGCSLMGVAAGIIFGVVALLTKRVVDLLNEYGYAHLLVSWEFYLLIFNALLGTVLQQEAFSLGNLHTSLPGMSVTEPIVAVLLGLVLLKEYFAISLASVILLILVAVLMLTAIIMLAKHE